MKRALALVLAAALALFVGAAQAGGPPNYVGGTPAAPTFTGTTTAQGGLVLGESLGPELVTLDATCTGWTLAAGWTCVAGTLAHDGAGTGTATYTAAGVVGTTYKVVHTSTMTVTTGGYTIAIGGTASASRTAAVTAQVDYLPASATTVLTITPGNTALRMVITALSVKAKLDTLSDASGPVIVAKDFANATANEVALRIATTQSGASGDKTALEINTNATAGSGAEYAINSKNSGTTTFSVAASGFVASASALQSDIQLQSLMTTPTTSGAFRSAAALTNANGAIFSYTGKPAAMSGTNTAEVVRCGWDLSNNHTGGNAICYSAPDLVSPDPDIVKYGVKIGTGYDYESAGPGIFKKSFVKTGITNNSATDIFTITLAAGELVTGRIFYGINATGGTNDLQAHTGDVTFACVNKGGTFTTDIDEVYLAANETQVVTAGTLADTWAMKAGNVCTVTLNINSNLSSAADSVRGEIMLSSQKPITLN